VLLLVLARRKDPDAAFLFLTALLPQRWFYDAFVLWLIPKTRQEILATAFLSWVPALLRWYHMPTNVELGQWTVLWFYLPMLFVILLRLPSEQELAVGKTGQEELRPGAIG
jgi:hypothetical protein